LALLFLRLEVNSVKYFFHLALWSRTWRLLRNLTCARVVVEDISLLDDTSLIVKRADEELLVVNVGCCSFPFSINLNAGFSFFVIQEARCFLVVTVAQHISLRQHEISVRFEISFSHHLIAFTVRISLIRRVSFRTD
jgi:hypothetical protein